MTPVSRSSIKKGWRKVNNTNNKTTITTTQPTVNDETTSTPLDLAPNNSQPTTVNTNSSSGAFSAPTDPQITNPFPRQAPNNSRPANFGAFSLHDMNNSQRSIYLSKEYPPRSKSSTSLYVFALVLIVTTVSITVIVILLFKYNKSMSDISISDLSIVRWIRRRPATTNDSPLLAQSLNNEDLY